MPMDVEIISLEIAGHGGEPVPNQFLRQHGDTATLAVLLPGQGYTARMPLFYYAEQIALDRGWDALSVDYSYPPLEHHDDLEVRQHRLVERKRELEADVEAAFAAGLDQRDYRRVVLIGKSLGTRAMTSLLARGIDHETWNVWLTPLINIPEVRKAIEAYPGRSFVAIGTADFAYDAAYLDQLHASGTAEVITVAGSDHSMDIEGAIVGSIRALGEVMSRLDAFLPPS